MSKFSKKANKEGFKSTIDFKGFNDHLEEVMDEVFEEEGNALPCIISGIIDTGVQTSWTEYPWEDSERQQKLLDADFGCEVDEENNLFKIPNRADSVVFYVDFPQIMVNYGRFFQGDGVPKKGEEFSYGEDDFKPYRELLAGEWENIATHTPVIAPYGAKSRIAKLAKATGLVKKGLPSDDFDIGELLGQWLMMTIETNRSGDENQYFNVRVKTPTTKPKAVPTPKYKLETFGVMFDGGNDLEELKFIRKSVLSLLEKAEGWEDSGLKAELDKVSKSKGKSGEDKKSTPKTKPKTTKPTEDYASDTQEEDEDTPF